MPGHAAGAISGADRDGEAGLAYTAHDAVYVMQCQSTRLTPSKWTAMPLATPTTGEPIVKRANVAVADALRSGIIRGDLAPGEEILEEEIAVALGVSRTPVREALLLLAGEQLIDLGATRGQRATVRAMSIAELGEVYEMRSLLEGVVAREASGRVTARMLDDLEESVKRMSRPRLGVFDLIEENELFHKTILSASGTSRLAFIVANLLQIPYQYKHSFWEDPECVGVDVAGHREIVSALRSGDADAAEAAMAKHLHDVGELVLEKLR